MSNDAPISDLARRKRRLKIQGVLASVVLLLGAGATALMIATKQTPPREPAPAVGPLVQVVTAQKLDVPVTVRGYGSVEPRVQVDIVPQVSGKVIEVSPAMVDGGRFKADEILIRIERADYELAVRQAAGAVEQSRGMVAERQAAVAQAQSDLELEQADAEVSRQDWRTMHGDEPIPSLAAREPQLRAARARLQSAEAQVQSAEADLTAAVARLSRAELDLQRTSISVPFNGRVMSESVDVGQYVTAGQSLATVYATDVLQIVVPLEDSQMQWLNLSDSSGRGVPATVSTDFAGRHRTWRGQAVRTTGQVDPKSRLVHVVVEVSNPFDVDTGGIALEPGMFVTVEIQGPTLPNVIRIPRTAVRQDQTVWIAADGQLQIRQVRIARMDRDWAYLTDGIDESESVITSSLDVVTQNMKVRVPEASQPQAESHE